ncbi:hypothetical protein [Paracoccus shandongensis]|uniref:hypothetical protein n=1 Tax=Paracoccus shandongensis TaxID=2816048 RepID=UPI001A906F08|nr:hypothetical protein [Paracoccus shandongensis]
MTHLIADPLSTNIHPLRVLDLPAAGYILDLARKFGCAFGWRFDAESLSGLVQLALQHVPGLEIRSCESLIRRLQLAGDLVQGDRGLELTPGGRERCQSTFHALLTAPEWRQAIDQIREDLSVFSETEGIPLMAGGMPAAGDRQAAMGLAF